jgi:hypothetical protein
MQHAGISVVTVAVDYEGPLAPFALLLPIPKDVSIERVKTLKRGILARLDEVSAPRFHAFYEQDPCDGGRTEQRWDERIRVAGRGFLAVEGLPPLDRRYAISNEISAPIEPVFKGAENEFRYRRLEFDEPAGLARWLEQNGYVASDEVLLALRPYVGRGKALLAAEVSTAHVELAGDRRVRLGGIRYWSRQSFGSIPLTLGSANAVDRRDVLVYVLDRKDRYEAKNYENLFVPANLRVVASAAEQVGRFYDALFDAVLPRSRPAFVTEYAWSTRGCGEPCADAPLGMDELMSLGGDVLEAQTASARERAGESALEEERDKARFAAQLAELRPSARAAARREHEGVLAELGRRRALMARQTYVLSRLHRRYDARAPTADLELRPAAPVRGGVGVPSGKTGELSRETRRAEQNELQVRLVSLEAWTFGMACASPVRHRWGKAWPSAARVSRAVPLAIELSTTPGARELLPRLLASPVPELGIGRAELRHAAPPAAPPPPASAAPAAASAPASGCAVSRAGPARGNRVLVWAWVFMAGLLGACLRAGRLWRARALRSAPLPSRCGRRVGSRAAPPINRHPTPHTVRPHRTAPARA